LRVGPFALSLVILSAGPALACLWDYDTALDEERGLPSLVDAVFGRYEVHSREYYEARRDRLLAQKELSPDDYDDLAVAYDRFKDFAKAASHMKEKEKRYPGRYTTQANWGTFLVHGGQLEAGLERLKKAVEINPDAHFGREKYQIRMIEYVLACKKDPKYAETHSVLGAPVAPGTGRFNVRAFYAEHPEIGEDVWSAVVGILKLGGDPGGGWHELYVVLGELLEGTESRYAWTRNKERDGDWRAMDVFFKHDIGISHRALARAAYRRAIEQGSPRADDLRSRIGEGDEKIEGRYTYDQVRRASKLWVDVYQEHERGLLKAGKDPHDLALWKTFYGENGRPLTLTWPRPVHMTELDYWRDPWRIVFCLVAFVALLIVLRVRKSRRRA
jgi:hypothetical protein